MEEFQFDRLFKAKVNNYLVDHYQEVIDTILSSKEGLASIGLYFDKVCDLLMPGFLKFDKETKVRGRRVVFNAPCYVYLQRNYLKDIDVAKLQSLKQCLILAELQLSSRATKQEKMRAKDIIANKIPRSIWLPHKKESPIAMLSDIKKTPGKYEDLDLQDGAETEDEEEIIFGDDDPELNVPDTYVAPVQDPAKKQNKKKVPVVSPRSLVNVQESFSWTKDSDQDQSFMKYLQPTKVGPRL